MKSILLVTTLVVLLINLLLGLVLQIYPLFNMGIECVIIVYSALLLFALQYAHFDIAFRIALSFIFAFLAVVNLVLGLVSPPKFEGNYYVVVIILIAAFKAVFMAVANVISKKVR